MICSRCDRPPSHGAIFVEVGDAEERVYVCGTCFVARDQTTDPIVAPVTSYQREPRQSLRERARAQGKDLP